MSAPTEQPEIIQASVGGEPASFYLWSRWVDSHDVLWIVVERFDPRYVNGRFQSTRATLLDVERECTKSYPITTLQDQAAIGKLKQVVGQVFSVQTSIQFPEHNEFTPTAPATGATDHDPDGPDGHGLQPESQASTDPAFAAAA